MGICASCLGLSRRKPYGPNGESSRLLDDDPYQSGYGTIQQTQAHGTYQPDPQAAKREAEALEAICQKTSDSVVDIWSFQPQVSLIPGEKGSKPRLYPAPISEASRSSSQTMSNGMNGKARDLEQWSQNSSRGSQKRPELFTTLKVDFS